MKKILFILITLISFISASAEVISFRTTAFSYRQKTYRGWTNWSNFESSDMLITMNTSNDVITIYSPTIQRYKIIEHKGNYIDSDGDGVIEFRFVDQDGDYGTMKLMERRMRSEIYIIFDNVNWVYVVEKQ